MENRYIKMCLKLVAVAISIMVVVVTLAIIALIRNPIPVYDKYNMSDLSQAFAERSPKEVEDMQKNLQILRETGSCPGCDFSVRKNEQDENNKDLLNAIQYAQGKGLKINLSGANLSLVQLPMVDLSGANLNEAHLFGANLKEANLQGASLKEANLDGATLIKANLQGADLTGVFMSDTNISEAHLTHAILHKAKLVFMTNLFAANLTNADLTDSVIMNVRSSEQAKFINTDFSGARIKGTFDKTAIMTGAKFDNYFIRMFGSLQLHLFGLRFIQNFFDLKRTYSIN